ncbi:hypothetical protein B9Q02_09700 [Candidatus Marsarchaeota G1 archaeon BE_D]|jgi:hypothetical protein|uniref:Uncharacterized protein n=1 Tax=Candidatus Marsarchaeota G1 archaeon BE_D TaxID=1978156 RepID=A0A2R6AD20_9ARCH|nr:MAG: hypothetical protein B9Q02_09700 [Candidatus Marsarchaeota G1 archaeon BE_D]
MSKEPSEDKTTTLLLSVSKVLENMNADADDLFTVATYLLGVLSADLTEDEYGEFMKEVGVAVSELRLNLKSLDSQV